MSVLTVSIQRGQRHGKWWRNQWRWRWLNQGVGRKVKYTRQGSWKGSGKSVKKVEEEEEEEEGVEEVEDD